MPKHFFFDLDNTLTRSRSHLRAEHAGILTRLSDVADIIVVSGGHSTQIAKQLEPEMAGRYSVLAQNGNEAVLHDGTKLWERRPTEAQKRAIVALIEKMKARLDLAVKDENDLIEDRGCSIAYSTIGHHEDVSKKEAYDPDHSERLALLEEFKDEVRALSEHDGIDVRSGGTTCLDFFPAGMNKGRNIQELLKVLDWKADECIYFGDALFPGGNDETVIGVIPTQAVKDYEATFSVLAEILA